MGSFKDRRITISEQCWNKFHDFNDMVRSLIPSRTGWKQVCSRCKRLKIWAMIRCRTDLHVRRPKEEESMIVWDHNYHRCDYAVDLGTMESLEFKARCLFARYCNIFFSHLNSTPKAASVKPTISFYLAPGCRISYPQTYNPLKYARVLYTTPKPADQKSQVNSPSVALNALSIANERASSDTC